MNMAKKILKENLYTIEETAQMLQVSTDTVRRYYGKGKIVGVKIGRRYYISETALRKFLKLQ